MTTIEPLVYAIDPPELSGVGEANVQLVVTNQTGNPVANLCLRVSSINDGLRVLGDARLMGEAIKPHASARYSLRFRAAPGTHRLRLESISLRLDGRPERLKDAELVLHVASPPVPPRIPQRFAQSKAHGELQAAVRIFISYSHEDAVLFEKLVTSLRSLERDRLIHPWHDRKIVPGTDWSMEIAAQLESAEIILLFVSPDFIASDYCFGKEMTRALERHRRGEACVIPIIARPADWESKPFGKLQALPHQGKPIAKWQNPDDAFLDIIRGIKWAIQSRPQLKGMPA